jgi:hypothetical protein
MPAVPQVTEKPLQELVTASPETQLAQALPRAAGRSASGFASTRLTGFEPVTFGFVDRVNIALAWE